MKIKIILTSKGGDIERVVEVQVEGELEAAIGEMVREHRTANPDSEGFDFTLRVAHA
ncbi:MAG: hypothetical protein RL839_10825 [Gammaproteobacteria bacterium]